MDMSQSPSDSYESISDALANDGYALIQHFVDPETVAVLRQHAIRLNATGKMHRAGIGQGRRFTLSNELRGDAIHWLDDQSMDSSAQPYMDKLEFLRQNLNRTLSLGLFEFEGHYAVYPSAAFYRRHLDQFKEDDHRRVTCILYLNEGWQESDGGQLRIYLNEDNQEEFLEVLPQGGLLVVFLSSRFSHEVMPANRERVSLTGWFKTRSTDLLR